MRFSGEGVRYGRMEIEFDETVDKIRVFAPNGGVDTALPFDHLPIKLEYDERGVERASACGKSVVLARYTPLEVGEYVFEAYLGEKLLEKDVVNVTDSANHGYVEVSKTDGRYFAYSDGAPFFWMGINLCFPTAYEVSSGREFGLSGDVAYLGLRQYERWFKRCAENGVNTVRIWLGHDYWSPDTENTCKLDPIRLSKLDMLVDLAKKYGLKLKLTVEQFRHFVYEGKGLFNKRLYHKGEPCRSSGQWLTDENFIEAWMYKIDQLARRYSGDTTVAMIELWNEMNCVGKHEDDPAIIEWNIRILPRVKALFPHQLVTNSLGSLDSDANAEFYRSFPWDETDAAQIHRYLDQGAPYEICGESPVASIKEAFEYMRGISDKPILLAETGAVNDCHSGEFKYYSADDRGIFFIDCVYTPLFVGSAGCGNIWHWDRRYVESKNLYKYFKPLCALAEGIKFDREDFKTVDLSNDEVDFLLLKGNKTTLGFVRNKKDSWMNTLRDMNEVRTVDVEISLNGNNAEIIRIWEDETVTDSLENGILTLKNLKYGALIKIV